MSVDFGKIEQLINQLSPDEIQALVLIWLAMEHGTASALAKIINRFTEHEESQSLNSSAKKAMINIGKISAKYKSDIREVLQHQYNIYPELIYELDNNVKAVNRVLNKLVSGIHKARTNDSSNGVYAMLQTVADIVATRLGKETLEPFFAGIMESTTIAENETDELEDDDNIISFVIIQNTDPDIIN